jgi:hypothetical protein
MPAFTFEKISPPASRGSVPATVPPIQKKPRGVILQILGRFAETRLQRVQRVEKDIIDRSEQREPE